MSYFIYTITEVAKMLAILALAIVALPFLLFVSLWEINNEAALVLSQEKKRK